MEKLADLTYKPSLVPMFQYSEDVWIYFSLN